jgi:hypothetical protein
MEGEMTKTILEVTASDLADLLDKVRQLGNFETAEEAAQAFVGTLYRYFQRSTVLIRLFTIVPYSQLAEADRQFVNRKGAEIETASLITETTPVFTLLGTRGRKPDWNDRRSSQHFRCIPLASTAFVSSLSMLSRQFRSVGLDPDLIDNWEVAVSACGRADQYSGMLYIRDAGEDRDEQGRMIVPKQDFVAANNVRTVLGFGRGYADHPTLVTLFVFTDEFIEKSSIVPLGSLLDAYMAFSADLVRQGNVFSQFHE